MAQAPPQFNSNDFFQGFSGGVENLDLLGFKENPAFTQIKDDPRPNVVTTSDFSSGFIPTDTRTFNSLEQVEIRRTDKMNDIARLVEQVSELRYRIDEIDDVFFRVRDYARQHPGAARRLRQEKQDALKEIKLLDSQSRRIALELGFKL